MDKVKLGKSNISVTRLCFGALTVGPLQLNMSPDEGGAVIAHALERGINFIDTAQLYQTYPHIRRGLELAENPDCVIASKTFAPDKDGAAEAVEEARREMNRDYIDIFLLHEQENEHTLRGHREAFDYLCECKSRGIIRAVGISTHHIAAVRAVCEMPEIDVIHPMINSRGLGIIDGTADEMLAALKVAHERGIGIYAMKALGGGNLISDVNAALDYALAQPCIDSIALGMKSAEEVDWNIEKFEGNGWLEPLSTENRELFIEEWCSGCGSCVKRCPQGALQIDNSLSGEKLVVAADKCVLCGYCAAACENFYIRIL